MLTPELCRVFIWFLTFSGLVVICIYGVEESTTLVNELDLVFRGEGDKEGYLLPNLPNISCL